MKKVILAAIITLISIGILWAQTPQSFKYQTVARNSAGEIMASQNISFRMSILLGVLPGIVVYSETHVVTTNATGIATLEIGRGTPVSGNFSSINWSPTPIFLKTEIDPAGGSAFVEMVTSELLSVPYALFAENTANNDDADADPTNELQTLAQNGNEVSLSKGGGVISVADNDNDPENELQTVIQTDYNVALTQGGGSFVTGIKSYTQAEIDAMTPYIGLTVFNSTTNCLNFYTSCNWYESCGTCTPQPSQANAGTDHYFTDVTTATTLEAGTPIHGTGLWTIVSGEGGIFDDVSNPISGFTGQDCESYCLMWSITTSCGSSYDSVIIGFNYQPTLPDAGPDMIGIGGSTTTLAANLPVDGTGLWTIVGGEGGSFGDPSSPVSTFSGEPATNYTLCWTISTTCASLSDSVNIYFWNCGLPFAVNHKATGGVAPVAKSVTYGTVTNIPGASSKCWITSNLGADQQATSVSDTTEAPAGWYWQFNRRQGYKHDGTTRTPNTVWISSITETSDWTMANDPCTIELGTGWRIPTSTELTNVDASGNWTNWNGPWNSGLKMHAAGYLSNIDGSLINHGSSGIYWSSSQNNATNGWYLGFFSGNSYTNYGIKANGFSLRCLKD